MKQQNRATARFYWNLHASPVFPETSGKRLGDSDVEQEEWAGRLDFSAHGVGGFHKVPPNVPPIYSDRGERLRTVGAEFISKSGLRSEFPPAPSFYPKIACSTFPKSK